jgi:hypothetical protein
MLAFLKALKAVWMRHLIITTITKKGVREEGII